jgi:opacity protein-like surface antigen
MHIRRAEFGEEDTDPYRIPDPRDEIMDYRGRGTGAIVEFDERPDKKPASAWNGIPVRLELGFHITPKLSIELAGRFDAYVVTNIEPVSCWDAAGGDLFTMVDVTPIDDDNDGVPDRYVNNDPGKCSFDWADPSPIEVSQLQNSPANIETLGKAAVAQENGETVTTSSNQIAWLVTARVRYQLITKGGLRGTVFGGAGYGHAHYRVSSTTGNDVYFPLIGMAAIELGPGVAYYFTDNIGLVFEVPITFLVGDGFAANFDFNLGLGAGF